MAQKHRERKTPEGGCGCVGASSGGGDGDRVHMDGFRGCDVGGLGAGGAGGCGEHKRGEVKVFRYDGGSGGSWQVN